MFLPGSCTGVTVEPERFDRGYLCPSLTLLWQREREDSCGDEPAADNCLESCSCSMGSLWNSSHLLALVPATEGSPVLHLLFPQRERFWLHPIPLLERDKMSWWDPRHIKRVRHCGRHWALWWICCLFSKWEGDIILLELKLFSKPLNYFIFHLIKSSFSPAYITFFVSCACLCCIPRESSWSL